MLTKAIYFLLFFILVFLLCILYQDSFIQYDSAGYINAIQIILDNKDVEDDMLRLTKPISIVLSTIAYFITKNFHFSFYFQSLFSLILFSIVMLRISGNFQIHPYGIQDYFLLLALPFGLPVFIKYGVAIMTDSFCWALTACGILLIQKMMQTNNKQYYYLVPIYFGFVFFSKESAILGLFYLLIFLISRKEFVSTITLLSIFSITILSMNLLIQNLTGKGILDWWHFARSDQKMSVLHLVNYLKQLYRVFDLYWFFILGGIFEYYKNKKKYSLLSVVLLGSMILLLIFPSLWYYRNDRILFSFLFPLILFAYFFYNFQKKIFYIFLILFFVVNHLTEFSLTTQVPLVSLRVSIVVGTVSFILIYLMDLFQLKDAKINRQNEEFDHFQH